MRLGTPRLSIVVPTVKGSEDWRGTVHALDQHARDSGAEIVLATARGPVPDGLGETVRSVHVPDSDVFALRARALEIARGEFVAIIEDHIVISDEWCNDVVAAFEARPEADAIIVGITNGSPRCLDRASFLLTFGPFLAPLDHVPQHRCPPPGIIAFRATVLPRTAPAPGYLEYELPALLRDAGRLAAVPDVRVEHVQHVGLRSFALHFHSGAAFAGRTGLSVAARPRRERLREAIALPGLLADQTRDGLARVGTVETVPCLAAVTMMAMANALGQLVGIARGSVGRSPSHLE